MSERETIEAEIRRLLREESRVVVLHAKLFAPDGLFSRLASSADERRAVTKTPLWKEAQSRLRELEKKEAEALTEAARQVQEKLPGAAYRVRLEAPLLPSGE